MHAHAHWTDHEERIAWNGVSRSLMAGQSPTPQQSARVEELASIRGVEDYTMDDRGDYEDGLTDSRHCLLSILDGHPEENRAGLQVSVDALVDACRKAYDMAWPPRTAPKI